MQNKGIKKVIAYICMLLTILSLGTGIPIPARAAGEDIVVLYTNDAHCSIDGNLGYAGVTLLEKQMKQQTPYVTLVDAGDAIQGAPIGTLSEGGDIIDIMNQAGYDFAVPGNHEFDYGMKRFLELATQLQGGYYSCNFTDLATGKTVLPACKMFAYGETKVAFVGVTTPESFTKSTPAYFQDGFGKYLYGFCEDDTGEKLYASVQASVDAARQEGADYVILVSHLGENGVTKYWSSDSVIRNTNGIDVCIDGHSHEVVPSNPIPNKDGKTVMISQTGTKIENIGRIIIKPDGTITSELVAEVPAVTGSYVVQKGDNLNKIAKKQLGSQLYWEEIYQANQDKLKNPNLLINGMNLTIPMGIINEKGMAADAGMDQYIKEIQAQFKETLKVVLGYTNYDLTVNDPITGKRAVRNAETNLGDLTADAFRYVLGAEVGLSNGGGIRNDMKAGEITYEDSLSVFLFGNMGCVAEVTGQQLKDALEMGAKSYPEEDGGFLHVSGAAYTIDASMPSGVQVDDKGNFAGVKGAYRVKDIQVNGQPLDLSETYTVASINYMLKSGGSGMSMFQGSNIIQDEVMVDVDILSTFINGQLGGNVGAEYANPAGQGRIKVK